MSAEKDREPLSTARSQASAPVGAVFLSYASQDAEAAQRICAALRSSGVEVWLDQSELRGGDAWDRQIRERIHDCRLFIGLISAHTEARDEGYFRREWKLAVDRTHDMADKKAFLLPVAIDNTSERGASVPDRFHEVQWTRLPGGEPSPEFVARIKRLLSPEVSPTSRSAMSAASNGPAIREEPLHTSWPLKSASVAVVAVIAAGLALLFADKFWWSKRAVSSTVSTGSQSSAVPQKSVAVLPLADMSEKHDQEPFTDGLTEELINRLSQAADLKVIARTSSFQFKGKNEDARTIAAKLGVAHLIEGSVRKFGTDVRVTVQLIRAGDGTHLWSQTYDRQLRDSFKIQDDIAGAVASQLSVSLNPASRSAPEVSPAYTLFRQGRAVAQTAFDSDSYQRGIDLLEAAVEQDPKLAIAWAELSRMRLAQYVDYPKAGVRDSVRTRALQEAHTSLTLAPDLADAHIALARVLMFLDWDWDGASAEIRRALELGPSNAHVVRNSYYLSTFLGHWDEALHRVQKATELDPLDHMNFVQLANAQLRVGDLGGAERSARMALNLSPISGYRTYLAWLIWLQGRHEEALAENARESSRLDRLEGDALFLHALGRNAEADRALSEVVKALGVTQPHEIGQLYAARGETDQAIAWWDRAINEHDPTVAYLLADARIPGQHDLINDHRFQGLLHRLNLLKPETTSR